MRCIGLGRQQEERGAAAPAQHHEGSGRCDQNELQRELLLAPFLAGFSVAVDRRVFSFSVLGLVLALTFAFVLRHACDSLELRHLLIARPWLTISSFVNGPSPNEPAVLSCVFNAQCRLWRACLRHFADTIAKKTGSGAVLASATAPVKIGLLSFGILLEAASSNEKSR